MFAISDSARQNTRKSENVVYTSRLALVAWVAMFIGSAASRVIWVEGFGYKDSPIWDYIVRLSLLVLLLLLTWFSPLLRQLRGFLVALLAFNFGIVGLVAISNLRLIAALPPNLFALISALLSVLLPVFLMALTLIRSGLSRRDLFLAKGNMRAQSTLLSPVFPPLRWTYMAPLAFTLIVIPFAVELIFQVHPDFALAPRILSALPMIVIFGLINAMQEEFTYRSVYLARLTSVIGKGQALLLTSVNFGINHWIGGHPSGLIGAITMFLAAYILGKSMLETRGAAWAFIMHCCADILVAVLLTMTASSF